jgi:hypothetical protein
MAKRSSAPEIRGQRTSKSSAANRELAVDRGDVPGKPVGRAHRRASVGASRACDAEKVGQLLNGGAGDVQRRSAGGAGGGSRRGDRPRVVALEGAESGKLFRALLKAHLGDSRNRR